MPRDYVLQVKAAPGFPGAAPPSPDGGAVSTGMTEGGAPEQDAPPADWAGDLYVEGDETDPEASYAKFTGGTGDVAWLDRAADGTITGWVRTPDGEVFRYTDANAWAMDVDGSQMVEQAGPLVDPNADPAAGGLDPEGDEPKYAAGDNGEVDPTEDEVDAELEQDEAQVEATDDEIADEMNAGDEALGDEDPPEDEADAEAELEDDDEDDLADLFGGKGKGKGKAKKKGLQFKSANGAHLRVVRR